MVEVGAILGGRFRVDRMLGAGGMGIVVAATHLELEQRVAIKVLHDELASNPTIVARFLREARAVARLRTDHVCRVFDVGRLDSGAPFIVMELLEGSDLGAVVVRGPVPSPLAVEYVVQACIALAEAHDSGVVHRDLKPANLFVTRRSDGGPMVKVLDFGIAKAATAAEAKLTHTTSTMGSPGYMSPEQIKSARDVDLRTDIWALGVTLYQLLSGRMPFAGIQLTEIAVNITTAAPAPLDVEPGLRAIVLRCLDKEAERRYPDVTVLAAALLPFCNPSAARFVHQLTGVHPVVGPAGSVVAATAPTAASLIEARDVAVTAGTVGHTVPPRGSSDAATPPRSRRWIWLGGLAVAMVTVGGGLLGLRSRSAPPPEPTAAAGSSIAVDAAPSLVVAVVPPAVVDAGDPWAERAPDDLVDATPGDAAPEAAVDVAIDTAVTPHAGGGSAGERGEPRMRAYREQFQQTLDNAEMLLGMVENDPDNYQQVVFGMLQTACIVGDVEKAQGFFDRLVDPKERVTAKRDCARMNVPLVARGAPPAAAGASKRK